MADCSCLACIATTCDIDLNVELALCLCEYKRCINFHTQCCLWEILLKCTSINCDHACTRSHKDTGNGMLTASCSDVSNLLLTWHCPYPPYLIFSSTGF